MDAQAIITVSAAVVACTQLAKWGFIPDKYGPISVVILSAIGVAFWAWSAGVFGFTRAGSEAITKTSGPPAGAGANPTT